MEGRKGKGGGGRKERREEGGKEGGKKGGRERGREEGREEGKKGGKKGGKEEGMKGGREGRKEERRTQATKCLTTTMILICGGSNVRNSVASDGLSIKASSMRRMEVIRSEM